MAAAPERCLPLLLVGGTDHDGVAAQPRAAGGGLASWARVVSLQGSRERERSGRWLASSASGVYVRSSHLSALAGTDDSGPPWQCGTIMSSLWGLLVVVLLLLLLYLASCFARSVGLSSSPPRDNMK